MSDRLSTHTSKNKNFCIFRSFSINFIVIDFKVKVFLNLFKNILRVNETKELESKAMSLQTINIQNVFRINYSLFRQYSRSLLTFFGITIEGSLH